MKVLDALISQLHSDITSLEAQIKTQNETIKSGIFTSTKEKLAARVKLLELNDELSLAKFELSKLIMP